MMLIPLHSECIISPLIILTVLMVVEHLRIWYEAIGIIFGSMTHCDASVNTALCFLLLMSNNIKVYN